MMPNSYSHNGIFNLHLKTIKGYKNLSWVWVADRKIHPRVTVWRQTVMPRDGFFLSAPNNHDKFFFLHTFWSAVFAFAIGVAIDKSCSYMLTSTILKADVISDIAVMSTSNVLTTELRDLIYNQCIWHHVLIFVFYLSHGSDKGM